ncbi:unnamed protein product [Adineta steineri]|uniref:Uncharacterized protein n=2 Tax=Adineta steineri TaxID=433720 RepID=A0A815FIB0_9BILA|nr:unnamed protein product [Adineta steineri]CAF1325652.1 unnamed protein product [Adineta steineri]CAF4050365.1 unnamed protein product [Adineta steineri]
MKKKRQQQKKKRQYSNKRTKLNRSARIQTKNFEIFVTDFLTDPCGLPVELKDCILVDGTIPINDNLDNCPLNNNQVLKKLYANSLDDEDSCKKIE